MTALPLSRRGRLAAISCLVALLGVAPGVASAAGLPAIITALTKFQAFLIIAGALLVVYAVIFIGWRIMFGEGMRGAWHVPVGAVIAGNAVVIAAFLYAGV